jgi:ABC-type uncharacterized transport system ATPase subunit
MPSALLELDGIDMRFGVTQALAGASLTVRTGSVHAVLGENGAVKTTLMRIAAGVVVYTNDIDELLALADRIVVAFNGSIRPVGHDRETVGRAMIGEA